MLSKFRIKVIIRIILTVAFLTASLYLFLQAGQFLPGGLTAFLAVISAISLFHVVNKTNRELTSFLMSIKYNDFELNFAKDSKEKAERELHSAFNLITGKFRNIRLEKEAQFQYFQSVVEQVDTGLIGFDKQGDTIFMNRALKEMIHKSYISTLESIRKFDPELHQVMQSMRPGERRLLRRVTATETVQLSIRMTQIRSVEDEYRLYAVQNIHAELEAQEISAWQKLIRILTHEIMNSVSPVVSLANSTNNLLKKAPEIDVETRDEVHAAVQAIEKRGEGLINFTQTFRQLTRIPPPKKIKLDAVELMQRIVTLLTPQLEKEGIHLETKFPNSAVAFSGDPEQLEQAFINLIKNASQAVAQNTTEKKITLSIKPMDEGKVRFAVMDNGPGIPEDIQDEIFVPFFTTRANGSGIGLSLCRQIISMHGGKIFLVSEENEGAEFNVVL